MSIWEENRPRPGSPHEMMQRLDDAGEAYWIENLIWNELIINRADVMAHSEKWTAIVPIGDDGDPLNPDCPMWVPLDCVGLKIVEG